MPYIYKITNLINGKIYVGKTAFSIEKRWKEHYADSKKGLDRPLYRAINKYGIDNFKIEQIEEVSTDEEACQREIYWISFYNSYYTGYNATFGGDGRQQYDPKQILTLWKEGLTNKEIAKVVGCSIDCIRDNLTLFNISVEERKERGFQKSIQTNSKQILMISKDTDEILKIFSSSREAARFLIKEQNLNPNNIGGYSGHIIEVCKGKRKTCQGYKWKYSGVE